MYKNKRIIHLVAVGANNEIGANNSLLWNIPQDMKFFRKTTMENVCIVGRKTAEGFFSPLKGRIILCVSNNEYDNFKTYTLENALNASVDFSDFLNTEVIYVIGGKSIYDQTADITDQLLITQVDKEYPEADTFYNIPEGFEMVDKCAWNTSVNGEKYRFTTWEKIPF